MAKKNNKQALLAQLEALSHAPRPEAIEAMDEETLQAVTAYVDAVLTHERAGMDGLFQSMSQTMKYIPRFLLQSLAQKFIEPPIAARITTHLKLKQAAGIASGLPPEYVAESAVYLEYDFAAHFLAALPAKQRVAILAVLLADYPEEGVAILAELDHSLRDGMDWPALIPDNIEHYLSKRRLGILQKLYG